MDRGGWKTFRFGKTPKAAERISFRLLSKQKFTPILRKTNIEASKREKSRGKKRKKKKQRKRNGEHGTNHGTNQHFVGWPVYQNMKT